MFEWFAKSSIDVLIEAEMAQTRSLGRTLKNFLLDLPLNRVVALAV